MTGIEIITIPSPARQQPKARPFAIIAAGLMSNIAFVPMDLGMIILISKIITSPIIPNGTGVDIPGRLDVNGSALSDHRFVLKRFGVELINMLVSNHRSRCWRRR